MGSLYSTGSVFMTCHGQHKRPILRQWPSKGQTVPQNRAYHPRPWPFKYKNLDLTRKHHKHFSNRTETEELTMATPSPIHVDFLFFCRVYNKQLSLLRSCFFHLAGFKIKKYFFYQKFYSFYYSSKTVKMAFNLKQLC